MENNKDNKSNMLVVIIIILSIALIFTVGYIVYQNYNLTNNLQNESGNTDKKETQKEDEAKEEKTLTKEEADTLYAKIVKDPIIEVSFPSKDKELKVSEMSNEKIGAIIYANMEETDKYQLCDTDTEKELISLGLFSERGAGQYDCDTVTAISVDKLKEIAKNIFGDSYNLVINSTSDKDATFYYYEKGNVVLFRYAGASYQEKFKMVDYKLDGDIAVLKVSSTYISGDESTVNYYNIKFQLVNDNYYLYSIESL